VASIRQQFWARVATDVASPVPGDAALAHGVNSIYGSDATPLVLDTAASLDAVFLNMTFDAEVAVPGNDHTMEGLLHWWAHDDIQSGWSRTRPLLQKIAYLHTLDWLGDGLIDSAGGEYVFWIGLPVIGPEVFDSGRSQTQLGLTIPYRKQYSGGGP
jgi:hypothetical protein